MDISTSYSTLQTSNAIGAQTLPFALGSLSNANSSFLSATTDQGFFSIALDSLESIGNFLPLSSISSDRATWTSTLGLDTGLLSRSTSLFYNDASAEVLSLSAISNEDFGNLLRSISNSVNESGLSQVIDRLSDGKDRLKEVFFELRTKTVEFFGAERADAFVSTNAANVMTFTPSALPGTGQEAPLSDQQRMSGRTAQPRTTSDSLPARRFPYEKPTSQTEEQNESGAGIGELLAKAVEQGLSLLKRVLSK